MERNDDYKQEYVTFMNGMIKNDFCKRVPVYDVNKPSWYIPHHGVYHRVKKKIRVVFDCSAKFNGKSLNDCLLTGPDLINSSWHLTTVSERATRFSMRHHKDVPTFQVAASPT